MADHREKEIIMAASRGSTIRNVVLVHGGFVDASGWEGVYRILRNDGYAVSVVQNPTISLADVATATRRGEMSRQLCA
jgi:hypothetical protein